MSDNLPDGEHKITLENDEKHFKNKTDSDIMNTDPLVLSNSDIVPGLTKQYIKLTTYLLLKQFL
jgi:hypothetical protein